MITSGEEKAWEILAGLDPEVICRNASAGYDSAGHSYFVRSFCYDFLINTRDRIVSPVSPSGEHLIRRYSYFFIHSCLWYLIHSKDIPETGRLVRPGDIKGGELFFRGSHVLPMDRLAERYGEDRKAFLQKGKELGADAAEYGDASMKLYPMPRVPVTLVLWLRDEEFPARADILFDSSCGIQLPVDIVWSTAMTTVLAVL